MGDFSLRRSLFAACLLAAMMLITAPARVHAEDGAESAEPAAAGAEGGEGEKAALPAAPDYMPMPVLNIPVLKKNRAAGNLMISMVLDVASDETMKAIDEKRTLLTATYAETLGGWAATFQNPRAPANVIAIKNQLQQVTDTVLGRSDAIVLLQGVMLNR
jgi:hypothetical protein